MQQRQRRGTPFFTFFAGAVLYAISIGLFWALSRAVFDMSDEAAFGLSLAVITYVAGLIAAMLIVTKFTARY